MMQAVSETPSDAVAVAPPGDADPGVDLGVDTVIRTLVDGNEFQRLATLVSARSMSPPARGALGRRLRAEIGGRFGPGAEQQFAEAIRDPKLLGSVRSWMISTLLACDPAHPETAALLERELSPSFEPDENVRFWTLAGCHHAGSAALRKMIRAAAADPARQVAVLARAILYPDDKDLRDGFRTAANSERFEAVWPYLRAMRVVGLPGWLPILVPLIGRAFDGVSLAYDALYALASPALAHEARPLLEQSPGLDATVAAVMEASQDSAPSAITLFGRFLSVFDPTATRARVASYLDNGRYRAVAQRILQVLDSMGSSPLDGNVSVVEYATDVIGKQVDRLGFTREVSVLTALMLSQEAVPPLAIGLFGSWGSGKSFFMQAMQNTADHLAARAGRTHSKRFCAHVVQIKFNAWHYTDTSLWASLATYILEALNAHFSPVQPIPSLQGDAAQDVALKKQALEAAEAARRQVAATLARDEATRVALQAAREAGTIHLSSFSLDDVKDIIASNAELKQLADRAAASMGLPKSVDALGALAGSLQDARGVAGDVSSMVAALFRARTAGVFILALLVVVFGTPALFEHLADAGLFDDAKARISTFVAEAGLALAALAHWVKQGVGVVRKSVDSVNKVRREIERVLESRTAPASLQEKLLDAKIAALKEQQEAAVREAASAQVALAASESRAAQTTSLALLKQFLSDKLKGDDYRKHLGLVATVRNDFDRLGQLIASQSLTDAGARPVERVILYIDDLDRCPAPKVVEVLQAVHLLLAYPLFVVVVGVDSRWLIHSLTTHYRQLGGVADAVDPEWTATPQRYLEKIFQISYAIKPMDSRGYDNLIGQLMANRAAADAPAHDSLPNGFSLPADSGRQAAPVVPADEANDAPTVAPHDVLHHAAPQKAAAPGPANASTPEPAPPDWLIEETAMTIHPLEMAFAKQLHAFILSPRAAKRLTNIYRLLKAGLNQEALPAFEGEQDVPGEFQVPMLLLAILVYDTEVAEAVFAALLAPAGGAFDLSRAIGAAALPPATVTSIGASILAVTAQAHFPNDPRLFRTWIPRVARFSFGTIGPRRPQ